MKKVVKIATMRILITGATGFIGRSLLPYLHTHTNHQLIALVRETTNIATLPISLKAIRAHIEWVYADLRNFQLTVRAVRQAEPDVVIHLAAVGVTDPFLPVETAVRHNITGTLNLLRACFEKTFSTQQLIIGRTPGEQTHMNVYSASKAAVWGFCQMYAQTQRWPIHGAMIYQGYGAGQSDKTLIISAVQRALAGEDFPMTSGEQQKDWVYLDDLLGGLTAMIGANLKPATTVELGTGRTTSVADTVRLIYQLAGRGGKPLIGHLPSRPAETQLQCANAPQTKAQIGWQATTSLKEGLLQILQNRGEFGRSE